MNPHDAQFCNHCGTQDLFEGATSLSFGCISRFLLLSGLFFGACAFWLWASHSPNLTVERWTGYPDVRIWLIERFANFLIILFVFSFLSAFIPGQAGTQFRSIMFGIVRRAIALSFKILEQMLATGWKLLLHAFGVGPSSNKKK